MPTKKKTSSTTKAWEIGGAITAAVAAAAVSAYLLADDKTKKKAKSWAFKAKNEIVKQAKNVKDFTQVEYDQLVDKAVKKYGAMDGASAAEVLATAKLLKSDWDQIHRHAKTLVGSVKKTSSKKDESKKKSSKASSAKKKTGGSKRAKKSSQ